MQKLIKSLQNFSKPEIIIFLDSVFDSKPDISKSFLKLLKYLTEDDRTSCLNALSNYINKEKFLQMLNETDMPQTQEIPDIEKIMDDILNAIPQQIKIMEDNTALAKKQTLEFRDILKAGWKTQVKTDQMAGVPIPPVQKCLEPDQITVNLPKPDKNILKKQNIFDCLENRISRRKFTEENLSVDELSFLLWATQGLKEKLFDGKMTKRTAPSGGSRHPFETYLVINHVDSLKPGFYRYQPLDHQIVFLFDTDDRQKKVADAALGQQFVGECAVTFIWSVIPYKCEWRYMLESKKIILQDSGHLCQNLYLACEALNLGTCAIGAYDQELSDKLLGFDSNEEFTVYMAPVGKL
jgi:SagB-type dehydrogenase family enzyme